MEALKNWSNDIDTYLPKLNKNQLISVLTQLGSNNEGKPDGICNKRKLRRWVQKGYKDTMWGERFRGENKLLQDLLNFTIPFTNSNGEHHKYGEH